MLSVSKQFYRPFSKIFKKCCKCYSGNANIADIKLNDIVDFIVPNWVITRPSLALVILMKEIKTFWKVFPAENRALDWRFVIKFLFLPDFQVFDCVIPEREFQVQVVYKKNCFACNVSIFNIVVLRSAYNWIIFRDLDSSFISV